MAVNSYLGVQQTPFAAALANMGSQLGQGMTKAYDQNQQHKVNIYNGLEAQLKQTLGNNPWAVLNESKDGEYTPRALAARGLMQQVELAFDGATGNLRSAEDITKSMEGRMAGLPSTDEMRNESFRNWVNQPKDTKQNSSLPNTAHSEAGVKPASKVTQSGASGVVQPAPVAPIATTLLPKPKPEMVARFSQQRNGWEVVPGVSKLVENSALKDWEYKVQGLEQQGFPRAAAEIQVGPKPTVVPSYVVGPPEKGIRSPAEIMRLGTGNSYIPPLPLFYDQMTAQDEALRQSGVRGFAEGGVVSPTPGGTQMDVGGQQAIVGEGKNSEAVLPLSDDVLGKLGAAIAQYVIQAMQNPNDKPTQGDTQDVPTNAQGMPMAEGGAVITPPTPFRKFLIDKGYDIKPTGPKSDEELMLNYYPKEAVNFRALQQPAYPYSPGQTDPQAVQLAARQTMSARQTEIDQQAEMNNQANRIQQADELQTTLAGIPANIGTPTPKQKPVVPGEVPIPITPGVAVPQQDAASMKPKWNYGEDIQITPSKGIAKLAEMANTAKQNLFQKLYVEYPSKGEPTPTNKQIFTDPKYAQLRGDVLKAVNKENQALSAITKDPSFMRADNKRMSKLFDEIAAMTPEQAAAAGFSDLAQVGVSKRNNETQWRITQLQEAYKAIGIARLADSLQYQLVNNQIVPIIQGCFDKGVFNEVAFTKAISKTPGLEDLWNQQVKLAGGNVKDAIALVTSPTWFGLGSKTELKRPGIQAPTLPGAAPQKNAGNQALLDAITAAAMGQ